MPITVEMIRGILHPLVILIAKLSIHLTHIKSYNLCCLPGDLIAEADV